MKIRHWIVLVLLMTVGTMQGCGSSGKVRSREWQPVGASEQKAGPPRPVDQMDAAAASPDLLAQKTKDYTQKMSPLVEAHPTAKTGLARKPNVVQWEDPETARIPDGSDLRLGPDSGASQAGATIPAAAQSAPAPAPAPAKTASPAPAKPSIASNSPIALAPSNPDTQLSAKPVVPTSSDGLSAKLSSQIKDDPRDVWAHTEYQMLRLIQDEPTPDLSTLAALPTEDRELVTAVLDGISNFRNTLRSDSNALLSTKVRPILEMADRLRSQADLTIPTLALCTDVKGFGKYERLPTSRFKVPAANERDNQFIVYFEVANFLSNLNDKQMWETRLTRDMTLYTDQAIPVWSAKTSSDVDESHVRRHDHFLREIVTLPRSLPPGRYLLKVSVVDTQSNHVAEATVPLVIVAQ
ncbi:MAG TPA: hypothetical protein VHD56_07010 [Tepidisphaeraceae bacterium]|nr:hypothetical protein [Tepidisphaeraceae bacterium]